MCWDNGLVLDAPGGKIELVFGARFLYDLAWFGQDDALEAGFGDIANDTEMRRASITIDGKLGDRIEFRVQPDFADFNNETRDVYIGFLNIPFFGRVRLGRQKEPIGLNEQTGQLNITFMERSLNSTFTSNRNDGVSASRSFLDQRLEMKYGVYLGETSREGDRSLNLAGRITSLPIRKSEREFLHLGFGYSLRQSKDNEAQLRSRPEANLAPFLVDTGVFGQETVNFFAPEVAWVQGPLSIQSELAVGRMSSEPLGNPVFWAAYLQTSFFLTGENRVYQSSEGRFGRVHPRSNFLFSRGPGAWEVAARVSRIDLNSGPVQGGKLLDFTAGVNWYLSPWVRFMANYVHSRRDPEGSLNAFMLRLQLGVR